MYFLRNNQKSDSSPKKKRDLLNFDVAEFPNNTIPKSKPPFINIELNSDSMYILIIYIIKCIF